MPLPAFKYHLDPVLSGSVRESDAKCRCCRKSRGHIYTGPAYAEDDLDDALCPWCIADGSAAKEFEATFVDSEAFPEGLSEDVIELITTRTPGYNTWQSERWPMCCGDATAFVEPAGIAELRAKYRAAEFTALNSIIYDLGISGGAAHRTLESLHRDKGPTAYVFQCLQCQTHHAVVDGIFSGGPA